jgi:hypothetical protein
MLPWCSLQTCRRHYPGGTAEPCHSCLLPTQRRGRVLHSGGLPQSYGGSAPTLHFSRPAQRSLTLRPACSRNRLMRSFRSKTSTVSLPPPPLRLLPAGATSCRAGLSPAGKPTQFMAYTRWRANLRPLLQLAADRDVGVGSSRRCRMAFGRTVRSPRPDIRADRGVGVQETIQRVCCRYGQSARLRRDNHTQLLP